MSPSPTPRPTDPRRPGPTPASPPADREIVLVTVRPSRFPAALVGLAIAAGVTACAGTAAPATDDKSSASSSSSARRARPPRRPRRRAPPGSGSRCRWPAGRSAATPAACRWRPASTSRDRDHQRRRRRGARARLRPGGRAHPRRAHRDRVRRHDPRRLRGGAGTRRAPCCSPSRWGRWTSSRTAWARGTDLPIPIGLALYGAGAAILLSFVVLLLFWRRPKLDADRRPGSPSRPVCSGCWTAPHGGSDCRRSRWHSPSWSPPSPSRGRTRRRATSRRGCCT